jgi:hypothetical protein
MENVSQSTLLLVSCDLTIMTSQSRLLAQMWDDTSIHWMGSSPLAIKSVPVPLKYMSKVYGNQNLSATWSRIKQSWHQWKVGIVSITSICAYKSEYLSLSWKNIIARGR